MSTEVAPALAPSIRRSTTDVVVTVVLLALMLLYGAVITASAPFLSFAAIHCPSAKECGMDMINAAVWTALLGPAVLFLATLTLVLVRQVRRQRTVLLAVFGVVAMIVLATVANGLAQVGGGMPFLFFPGR